MDLYPDLCGLDLCVTVDPDATVRQMNTAVQDAVFAALEFRAPEDKTKKAAKKATKKAAKKVTKKDGQRPKRKTKPLADSRCGDSLAAELRVAGPDGTVLDDDDMPLSGTGLQMGDRVTVVARTGTPLHHRLMTDAIRSGSDAELLQAVTELRIHLETDPKEWRVATLLGEQPPVLPRLVACLSSEQAGLQHEAVCVVSIVILRLRRDKDALLQLVEAGALPPLVQLAASHESSRIRKTGAECLGGLGSPDAIYTAMAEAGGLRAVCEGYLLDPADADMKQVIRAIGCCTGRVVRAEQEEEYRLAARVLGTILSSEAGSPVDEVAWKAVWRLIYYSERPQAMLSAEFPDVAEKAVAVVVDSRRTDVQRVTAASLLGCLAERERMLMQVVVFSGFLARGAEIVAAYRDPHPVVDAVFRELCRIACAHSWDFWCEESLWDAVGGNVDVPSATRAGTHSRRPDFSEYALGCIWVLQTIEPKARRNELLDKIRQCRQSGNKKRRLAASAILRCLSARQPRRYPVQAWK
eukprot:Rhum_TRINITY_DN14888_c2_g3::Rhum_TRINITY_DN14888_c2_g3_i2::g.124988::m.124988